MSPLGRASFPPPATFMHIARMTCHRGLPCRRTCQIRRVLGHTVYGTDVASTILLDVDNEGIASIDTVLLILNSSGASLAVNDDASTLNDLAWQWLASTCSRSRNLGGLEVSHDGAALRAPVSVAPARGH